MRIVAMGGGWSALGRAVFKGHVGVVRVLLEDGGADPGVGRVCGDSMLEYAERQLWGPVCERQGRYVEIVQMLREWARKGEPQPEPEQAGGVWGWFEAMWR